ncbi:uncharacterized protein JCM15063_003926 [Sporobolomyces koalae]|uniref:uncharacterized protein n=1 Tax=Sporobolomyces koalae TaxID=500713 RepID=UPI00316DE761
MLSTLVAASLASGALAQSFTPLASKRFDYNNLPYQADNTTGVRGGQFGYNRCNATTETQDSRCQTAIINAVDDFCLWAPPEPGAEVGNVEGEMVAWCTKEGHGTRIIPEGALQGVQFMRTPHYVQVVGQIDQSKINIDPSDYGGEMDPHGADQRGNPLGGLVFSNAFGSNSTTSGTTNSGTAYQQVIQWHNFMGGGQFCLKACDPSYELGYAMCEHIFDRIGCVYNAPADYQAINGTFQSCQGDDQLYPGVYVENGATRTYTQPPESLGPISTIPYTPFTPSSSSCSTYQSAQLYTAAAAIATSSSSAVSSSASTTSGASSAASTGSQSGSQSGSSTATAINGAATSQAGSNNNTSGAEQVKVGGLVAALAAMVAFAF